MYVGSMKDLAYLADFNVATADSPTIVAQQEDDNFVISAILMAYDFP